MNIPGNLNIKGVQIATIVFLIISAVLVWQIVNFYPEIGATQENIKAQKIIAEDFADTLERLEGLVGFVAKNPEIIDKFDLILPDEEEKAVLLSNLDSLAGANGLSVVNINFENSDNSKSETQGAAGAMIKSSDFDSKIVKISVLGSYISFKKFLTAIEKNTRVMDVVSVDFSSGSSSKEKEAEKKSYLHNIELKTYLSKSSKDDNIAKLLSGSKFKSFSVKNLNFIKESAFSGLTSSDYNINATAEEIGNEEIF